MPRGSGVQAADPRIAAPLQMHRPGNTKRSPLSCQACNATLISKAQNRTGGVFYRFFNQRNVEQGECHDASEVF